MLLVPPIIYLSFSVSLLVRRSYRIEVVIGGQGIT